MSPYRRVRGDSRRSSLGQATRSRAEIAACRPSNSFCRSTCIKVIPIADIGVIIDSRDMKSPTSEPSSRHWLIGSWSVYVALLFPASFLAYIGILWITASERGWQTQIAAAALVAAWFSLASGAFYTWTTSKAETRPSRLSKTAFFLVALFFYAVAFAWGGRMMI